MLTKRIFLIISLIILNTLVYLNGQNIVIKYVGNSENSINLTCLYSELGNNISTLTKTNRILTIKSNKPQCINCVDRFRNSFIYAEPNETIYLDINKRGLIIYSCAKSPCRKFESMFINDCIEKYGPSEAIFIKKIRALQQTGKSKQSIELDENYTGEKKLLDEYYAKKMVSRQFYDYIKHLYWSLSVENKMNNPTEQNAGLNELKKSFPNADNLINVIEYRRCLLMYSQLVMKNSKIKTSLYNSLQFVSTHFPNQTIIDYLTFSNIKFYLLYSKQKIDSKSLSLFYNLCKNKEFLDEIKTDFDQSTKSVFLKKIIEKSACKFAIIDFWASWCKPCLEELPYSAKRIKEYPQVKYIFISIDKSKAAWLNEMKKRPELFNSTNSFLINEIYDDDLMSKLKITTIPRYVLLNQNGEVVNLNFPRSSDPNFKTVIDEILKKHQIYSHIN